MQFVLLRRCCKKVLIIFYCTLQYTKITVDATYVGFLHIHVLGLYLRWHLVDGSVTIGACTLWFEAWSLGPWQWGNTQHASRKGPLTFKYFAAIFCQNTYLLKLYIVFLRPIKKTWLLIFPIFHHIAVYLPSL